MVQSVATARSS